MKKLLAAVAAVVLLLACSPFASAEEPAGVFVPSFQTFMDAFVPKVEAIDPDYAAKIREECFVDGKWVEPATSSNNIYYYYLATKARFNEGHGFLNYIYIDLPKDHIDKEEDIFKQLILAAATSLITDAGEDFKKSLFENLYYDYAKESPADYISMDWQCGVYKFDFTKSSSGLQFSMTLSVYD